MLKTQKPLSWFLLAFLAEQGRPGTVPTLTGAGTGSWRHNRVAGAGIEPASGGYEPPEVPLLYPAISILLRSYESRFHRDTSPLPRYS